MARRDDLRRLVAGHSRQGPPYGRPARRRVPGGTAHARPDRDGLGHVRAAGHQRAGDGRHGAHRNDTAGGAAVGHVAGCDAPRPFGARGYAGEGRRGRSDRRHGRSDHGRRDRHAAAGRDEGRKGRRRSALRTAFPGGALAHFRHADPREDTAVVHVVAGTRRVLGVGAVAAVDDVEREPRPAHADRGARGHVEVDGVERAAQLDVHGRAGTGKAHVEPVECAPEAARLQAALGQVEAGADQDPFELHLERQRVRRVQLPAADASGQERQPAAVVHAQRDARLGVLLLHLHPCPAFARTLPPLDQPPVRDGPRRHVEPRGDELDAQLDGLDALGSRHRDGLPGAGRDVEAPGGQDRQGGQHDPRSQQREPRGPGALDGDAQPGRDEQDGPHAERVVPEAPGQAAAGVEEREDAQPDQEHAVRDVDPVRTPRARDGRVGVGHGLPRHCNSLRPSARGRSASDRQRPALVGDTPKRGVERGRHVGCTRGGDAQPSVDRRSRGRRIDGPNGARPWRRSLGPGRAPTLRQSVSLRGAEPSLDRAGHGHGHSERGPAG